MSNGRTSTTVTQFSGQTTKERLRGSAQVCRIAAPVLFDTARSFIKPDQKPALERAFDFGLTRSDRGIIPKSDQYLLIIGHADQVGSRQQNQQLSERRANAVWAVFTVDATIWERLYQTESWGAAEIGIMSAQVDIGGDSTLIQRYLNDRAARFGLLERYLIFLRPDWLPLQSPPIKPSTVSAPSPPLIGCGEDQPLRDAPGASVPENRRAEFFYFKLPNPGLRECPSRATYRAWQTVCGRPAISVRVELVDECDRPFAGLFDLTLPNGGRLNGQRTDGQGRWTRSNLPQGQYTVHVDVTARHKVLSAADSLFRVQLLRPITAVGTALSRGGTGFRFFGTNAYYLMESEALGRQGSAQGQRQLADLFRIMQNCGIKVVRTWGFNDDQAKPMITRTQFQNPSGQIGFGPGLDALEEVIDEAARHGIYLIIPLVNYWHDYGGISQYARWAGYNTTGPNGDPDHLVEELFYTGRITSDPAAGSGVNRDPNDIYLNYACHVINRFRDKTNILAWELMNEPRARAVGAPRRQSALLDALRSWIGRTAGAIKRTCPPSQLLSIGGVDIERMDFFFRNAGVRSSIDLADTHLYPVHSGFDANRAETELRNALREASSSGKPFYLGEFGIEAGAPGRGPNRSREYAQWADILRTGGAAGMLFWQLLPPSRPAFDGNEVNVDSAQPPLAGPLQNVPPPAGSTQSQPRDGSQVADFVNRELGRWRIC